MQEKKSGLHWNCFKRNLGEKNRHCNPFQVKSFQQAQAAKAKICAVYWPCQNISRCGCYFKSTSPCFDWVPKILFWNTMQPRVLWPCVWIGWGHTLWPSTIFRTSPDVVFSCLWPALLTTLSLTHRPCWKLGPHTHYITTEQSWRFVTLAMFSLRMFIWSFGRRMWSYIVLTCDRSSARNIIILCVFPTIMIKELRELLLCHLWAKIGALTFSQQSRHTQAKVTWTNKTMHCIPSNVGYCLDIFLQKHRIFCKKRCGQIHNIKI